MPDTGMDTVNTSEGSPESVPDQPAQPSAPYEGVLSSVVAKIRDQPFLFVIAIAALIIGAVVLGAKLGSSDLRFVIIVIAALAVIVIAGYYVREGAKMAARKRKAPEPKGKRKAPPRQQKMAVADGAKLNGALQEGSGVASQVISLRGEGTSGKDLMQTSTGEPPDNGKQE
jgi:hypothetical protein